MLIQTDRETVYKHYGGTDGPMTNTMLIQTDRETVDKHYGGADGPMTNTMLIQTERLLTNTMGVQMDL